MASKFFFPLSRSQRFAFRHNDYEPESVNPLNICDDTTQNYEDDL